MTTDRARAALAAAAAALVLAAACTPGGDPPPDATVAIGDGEVRGVAADGYREFLGIPYAAPPVGDLRWRPPQPAEPWDGTLDATRPAPRCLQDARLSGDDVDRSEDCLHLNVTVPDDAGADLPVMVWIHGGGFIEGAGDEYDPRRLAVEGGVAVVTLNYRLGVFGYFGHPGLDGSGSYGLLDQQAALRWVEAHIGAFGGDPGNVTVFGQSAGGQSICAHLASPSAEGLFDRAIIQSAFCTWDLPASMLAPGMPAASPWEEAGDRAARGSAAAASLGCDGEDPVACLRGLPADALMPVFGEFAGPAYGTPDFPDDPYLALLEGRTRPVPVLSGTTRDENTLLQALQDLAGGPLREEEYRGRLAAAFGAHVDEVDANYPLASFASPGHAWAAVTTDRAFTCPTIERTLLLARRAPAFAYEFADPNPPPILPEVEYPYGAYHSADEAYLFDERFPSGRPALDDAQRELARDMIAYWTRFARTGDPGRGPQPAWDPVDADPAPRVQSLAPGTIGPADVWAAHQCPFWTEAAASAR
ncbi:carboxylesterase/lipase family protein [Glycomyces terrestris]|uniref:Carboxylic ester hydrolase n=1 Tax=Glycomyces terrestris TaxID=2493553 RepID=A0A426V302_9ACTN|nr:carboxylesterase family protein [Glycomyces terrestris]RRS01236.1 carboxylesterase family protein [Glycomyces terrestris]